MKRVMQMLSAAVAIALSAAAWAQTVVDST
jgi:hypothetical protein